MVQSGQQIEIARLMGRDMTQPFIATVQEVTGNTFDVVSQSGNSYTMFMNRDEINVYSTVE